METAESTHGSLRILVVDDHPDTLKYLELYLVECGHSVRHARGVMEALQALRDEPSDVLLTDIGLPDGNGWELMNRLKEEHCVPRFAIAMSGFGLHSDRTRSTAAGFRHHLVKPLDPDKLDQALVEAAEAREVALR